MRKCLLFTFLSLLIFSGCSNASKTDVILADATDSNVSTPSEASSDPVTSENIMVTTDPSSALNETYAVFMSHSPSLSDLAAYIDTNIPTVSADLADQMLQDWIVMLDLSSSERDTVFYGSDSELYFKTLYEVANALSESHGATLFMGTPKAEVALQVKDYDVQNYLNALYDEGYGLMSSEGLFYAYPDYIYILDHYGQYASSSLNQYLEVMVNEIQTPLFAEETLNVSVETLFQRTYYYETLFASTQDLQKQLRMNLAGLLNMCYYRLLVPSSYDMLDDEHRVSETLKAFYQEAVAHNDTPLTAALCAEMLSFFNEKDDILNVFDDPRIYEHANLYFESHLGNALNIGE
ncbi:hypothetical protein [Fusibacter sp. 3D3]|uniref:hypothetical protein n=1 Tax=Fusibacter sp. 3D3 TaxID=1048380 RepID=UPI000852D3B9|nr:hypothetical protein [Fusibacter sp. 3D3]GAU78413.1 hypothetical protein F3D3_3046 [Fusibacter sp. 3D3]